MTGEQKKKLIGSNVVVLGVAMLASFVLPKISESALEGRADFLTAVAHVFPLFCGIAVSTALINKSVSTTTE